MAALPAIRRRVTQRPVAARPATRRRVRPVPLTLPPVLLTLPPVLRVPATGHLWPAGCLEIGWSGPADIDVRAHAGACVEVGHLYVEPAFRRHGIGRALVAAAEQHCLAAGQPRLVGALPPDALGGAGAEGAASQRAVTERALFTAARSGYLRLLGTRSPSGPTWVCKDLPEVAARPARAARTAGRAVPGSPP